MLLNINAENPQPRLIQQAVGILENEGVIIYPTDTVYGLGCSIANKKGVERIQRIKDMDPKKPLTIICKDERQFQEYTQGISSPIFKILRSHLPGPYTFIFKASKSIPKAVLGKRKNVGIRYPNHPIALALVEQLGKPILSCSLYSSEDRLFDDPEELHEQFEKQVDLVIDGGTIFAEHSSIVDFSEETPRLIREGKGSTSFFLE